MLYEVITYTKWKKSVKLTFYEWNDFESWNGEYKTGLNWEIGEVIFRNKFESISSKMTSIVITSYSIHYTKLYEYHS